MNLVALAPLRLEARAVSSGARRAQVVRTGLGPRRAARAARELARDPVVADAAVAVVGLGGAVADGISAGDVVVASEVRGPEGDVIELPGAGLVAAALRRAGVRVHVGPVHSVARIAGARTRRTRRDAGALAVDMESAWLLPSVQDRPLAIVRVIVDTPTHPLTSPRTLVSGVRALRVLRRVGRGLAEWAEVCAPRSVVLAAPRSFCAGVERAIDTVERALARTGAPVYVRRQIVHNTHVVEDLEARGAVFVAELDEVPPGATVVLAAHGVAPSVRQDALERALSVIDATCPLVAKVHAEARRFVTGGHEIVVVGHDDHEEVEGTLGAILAESGRAHVVSTVADVDALDVRDPDRVAYLTQTTLAIDDTARIIDALRARFPAIAGPRTDDICYASQNRQDAVRAVSRDVQLVLVIGSRNSSNSNRLVEVAQRAGVMAHLVEDEREIDLAWLSGVRSIGITAGASAPEVLVDRLVRALGGLGPLSVTEQVTTSERVRFALPAEVA